VTDVVWRKARKEHTCSLCELPIAVGVEYGYCRIAWWEHWDADPGMFWDYRAHHICDRVWDQIGVDWDWQWDGPEFRRELLARYPVHAQYLDRFLNDPESYRLAFAGVTP
jgi:hypothetical protein